MISKDSIKATAKRLKAAKDLLNERLKALAYRDPLCHLILSILLTFIIEALVRDSLWSAVVFTFTRPHIFLFNVLIVFITFSFTLLIKRRIPATILIALVWLAFGITDFIEGQFRVTPFNAMDISLLFSIFPIFKKYLSPFVIILIIVGIALAVALVILLFVKYKKSEINFRVGAITIAVSLLILFGTSVIYTQTSVLPGKFESLGSAYDSYGFPYCFTVGIFDRGIRKPDGYSKDKIDQIKDTEPVSTESDTPPQDSVTPPSDIISDGKTKPNVIFLQLESFVDASELINIECTANPTPVFSSLKKSYPNGHLHVPTVGTGTVNTEFEILTGINVTHFGTAEYPYQTVLRNTSCESLAFNLKENGYTAHAVHNYSGTFYNRNEVYANLGFDTFTSSEYMQNVEYTASGWEKDAVIADYIVKCLDSTEHVDFVYGITVQAHGRYPHRDPGTEMPIDLTGAESEEEYWTYRYYIDQLRQTDAFIGELIARINERGEPTVIVMFGDHTPNIDGLTAEDLATGDLYQTEYIIWDNFKPDRTTKVKDLQAFQLSANIMRMLGYSNGLFTALHQRRGDTVTPEYDLELEMLAFDVLYGDRYAYDGNKDRYKATELNMGIDPIEIIGAEYLNGRLILSCTGVTPMTQIKLNGKNLKTMMISDDVLCATVDLDTGETYTVELWQVTDNGLDITREYSETYTFD